MGGGHFREPEGLRRDILVYIHMPHMIYEMRNDRRYHVYRERVEYDEVNLLPI